MFSIDEKNKIALTRGDTAYLTVGLDGYEPQAGDTLTLTVKMDENKDEILFTRTISPDTTLTFEIEPQDTKSAKFEKYFYDIQLDTADGKVFTVIEPTTFKITREATV